MLQRTQPISIVVEEENTRAVALVFQIKPAYAGLSEVDTVGFDYVDPLWKV